MSNSVRVWFCNTSIQSRFNGSAVRKIIEDAPSARQYLPQEQALGEEYARQMVLSMFEEDIVEMDIIEASLTLRAKESLDEHLGKTILVLNSDRAQMEKLVSSYLLPKGCTEISVVFVSSSLDPEFSFKKMILRDTGKDIAVSPKRLPA